MIWPVFSISLALIQIVLYLTLRRTQGLFQAQTIEIRGSCWSCSCMANMRSRDYMLGRLPVDWMHILNNEKERNYRVEQAREYRMLVLTLYWGLYRAGVSSKFFFEMPQKGRRTGLGWEVAALGRGRWHTWCHRVWNLRRGLDSRHATGCDMHRSNRKLRVDLMDFVRQPGSLRCSARVMRRPLCGLIITDYDKLCQRRFYFNTPKCLWCHWHWIWDERANNNRKKYTHKVGPCQL